MLGCAYRALHGTLLLPAERVALGLSHGGNDVCENSFPNAVRKPRAALLQRAVVQVGWGSGVGACETRGSVGYGLGECGLARSPVRTWYDVRKPNAVLDTGYLTPGHASLACC